MRTQLPTCALTLSRIPARDAANRDIIRFAQSLDGYAVCGGREALVDHLRNVRGGHGSVNDVRLSLFATQRAHYFQGGGYGDDDPLMDDMRSLTEHIRRLVADLGSTVDSWTGDITTLSVDAVVNAANERMLGGAGVDGAIHAAAGPELREACEQVPEVRPGVRCPTGEARITPGFKLPAKHVIHTVGPVWRGGAVGEAEQLASAYRSSLQLALENDLSSIAFPAISTGAYGYPAEEAERVATDTIHQVLAESAKTIRVVQVVFPGR